MADMTLEQKRIFVERLTTLSQAATSLLTVWEAHGDEFNEKFPFNESFDETCLGISDWLAECRMKVDRERIAADKTRATVVLDITDNGPEFTNWALEHGITYTITAKIWNGWSAKFEGSRLALELMVAQYWGDEDGTMGELEKIKNVEGAPA